MDTHHGRFYGAMESTRVKVASHVLAIIGWISVAATVVLCLAGVVLSPGVTGGPVATSWELSQLAVNASMVTIAVAIGAWIAGLIVSLCGNRRR